MHPESQARSRWELWGQLDHLITSDVPGREALGTLFFWSTAVVRSCAFVQFSHKPFFVRAMRAQSCSCTQSALCAILRQDRRGFCLVEVVKCGPKAGAEDNIMLLRYAC